MAQAFEIPTGNRTATKGSSIDVLLEAIRRVPRHAFQIAAPGAARPHQLDRQLKYGAAVGSPQAPQSKPEATAAESFPGSGDPLKVNQFCQI